MENAFQSHLAALNIELSKRQLEQFAIYYNLLLEWNDKMNLTSITDKEEVYIKHFYDCICLNKAVPFHTQTLLDVGSGAGFPSIPLKIIYPNLQVTIIDALQKRISFLQKLTDSLELDVELIHGRVEEFTHKNQYEIVTARAVANLRMLAELCIPFVKAGGLFLAMKGPKHQEEIQQADHAVKILNAHVEDVVEYEIDAYNRSIVVIKKDQESPLKYPRKYKKIKSKPL